MRKKCHYNIIIKDSSNFHHTSTHSNMYELYLYAMVNRFIHKNFPHYLYAVNVPPQQQ